MQTPISDIGTLRSGFKLPFAFVRWYYLEMPLAIIKAYRDYALAFMEMFAFAFLLKTLFSPWKRILDAYPSKGFDLSAIAQTFTLNCTTRAIGAVIRLSSIALGIVVEVLCLLAFIAWLAFWLAYPLLLVFGIPALLASFF